MELKKEEEILCLNIEEILVEFREVNKDIGEGEMVVGLAGVKVLYSSLDILFIVEKVREVFYISGV